VCVQDDYMANDVYDQTSDGFLEVYLLWLFGWVLFCESAGDSVSRCMTPRLRGSPMHPLSRCSRSAGAALFWQLPTGGCVRQ
jgi:hypothetical protein